jgi:thiamine pyrophosphate-dependent acetolactate synthase large subunit-like protein
LLETHRKVVNIVGDGAANYVIQSIWTALLEVEIDRSYPTLL